MGYFSHLLDTSKKGVPGVPSVPTLIKTNISKGFDGTQNSTTPKMQNVPSVPTGTPRTQAENGKIAKSVPINIIKNNMLHGKRTQEPLEHVKNSLSVFERETFEERAAIIEYDANIPRNWAEAFARMDCSTKPCQLTPSCWERIKNATGVLLDKHIHALIAHGWQVADIFGCHAVAPERNYSVMGLVFLMANMEVTHIDAEAITLTTPGGTVQKYRKPPQGYNKVMVWELQTEKE